MHSPVATAAALCASLDGVPDAGMNRLFRAVLTGPLDPSEKRDVLTRIAGLTPFDMASLIAELRADLPPHATLLRPVLLARLHKMLEQVPDQPARFAETMDTFEAARPLWTGDSAEAGIQGWLDLKRALDGYQQAGGEHSVLGLGAKGPQRWEFEDQAGACLADCLPAVASPQSPADSCHRIARFACNVAKHYGFGHCLSEDSETYLAAGLQQDNAAKQRMRETAEVKSEEHTTRRLLYYIAPPLAVVVLLLAGSLGVIWSRTSTSDIAQSPPPAVPPPASAKPPPPAAVAGKGSETPPPTPAARPAIAPAEASAVPAPARAKPEPGIPAQSTEPASAPAGAESNPSSVTGEAPTAPIPPSAPAEPGASALPEAPPTGMPAPKEPEPPSPPAADPTVFEDSKVVSPQKLPGTIANGDTSVPTSPLPDPSVISPPGAPPAKPVDNAVGPGQPTTDGTPPPAGSMPFPATKTPAEPPPADPTQVLVAEEPLGNIVFNSERKVTTDLKKKLPAKVEIRLHGRAILERVVASQVPATARGHKTREVEFPTALLANSLAISFKYKDTRKPDQIAKLFISDRERMLSCHAEQHPEMSFLGLLQRNGLRFAVVELISHADEKPMLVALTRPVKHNFVLGENGAASIRPGSVPLAPKLDPWDKLYLGAGRVIDAEGQVFEFGGSWLTRAQTYQWPIPSLTPLAEKFGLGAISVVTSPIGDSVNLSIRPASSSQDARFASWVKGVEIRATLYRLVPYGALGQEKQPGSPEHIRVIAIQPDEATDVGRTSRGTAISGARGP
jgi:hypothetical protein